MRGRPDFQKRERARVLRLAGWSLQQIGDDLGISRERARQLIGDVVKRPPVYGPPAPPLSFSTRIGAARLGVSPYVYQELRDAGKRWCSVHKAWEPSEGFGFNSQSSDGIARVCRKGNIENVRRVQGNDYHRQYRKKNQEAYNLYHREYRERNREKLNAYARDRYREKCQKVWP